MASPAVVGTPTETAISTAGTSHVVNLPSGTTGNLLLAIMQKGSAGTTPTVNSLTGWNELLDEAQTLGLYIAWRLADGTEGATTTFTLSSATRGAWIVYEISGMHDPAVQPPQIGTTATGSGTTPNPPSVSVTGGSKDILTIACFGRDGEEADDDTWVTSAPSGFGGLLQKACGTAGTNLAGMIATAHLASTTATSDPATFTAATGAWRAQTIVVHPVPTPTQTAVARISLSAGGPPAVDTGHAIKVRARTTSGAGTIRAALYEGANNRSGDLESSALTTSLADYTLSIAEASAANITDYSNLEIRLWGYAAGGGAIVFEVDQLWLETPVAAYTLDCQPGSFTVTGTAATLAAGKVFDAQPGAYTVTGAAATLARGLYVDAQPGSFAVTGTAATLLAARNVTADPASYTVTGTAATLALGEVFLADPGAYTVTGVAATLLVAKAVDAQPGAYTVTGVAADLVPTTVNHYSLDCQPGSFTLTGTAATIVPGRTLDAQPGTYAVAAPDATFVDPCAYGSGTYGHGPYGTCDPLAMLEADPGSFSVSGNAATLAAAELFDAQPGTYAVTGFQADLVLAVPGVYSIHAEPGAVTVTGVNATTTAARTLDAQPGSYTVTGVAASFVGEHNINAAAGTVTITGTAATLLAARQLDAQPAAYTFTGFQASIGTIFDMEIDAATGTITVTGTAANLDFEPGLTRLTTRGGRIRWNTTGGFRSANRTGSITKNKEGAVA